MIIATKDLGSVAEAGITTKHFLEPANRLVFSAITSYHSEYGKVPTLAMMKADFPTFRFVAVDEPYDFLIERMRTAHALAILEEGLRAAVDAHDQSDVRAVQSAMSQALVQVAVEVPTGHDIDLTKTVDARFERYRTYVDQADELRGIPSGFPSIDRATMGFQDGQLVVIVGPPKAGKSTIMLLAEMAAHRHGFSPLCVGFEMTNSEVEERFDSINAEISHYRLRSGRLKPIEWKRLKKAGEALKSKPEFILSADASSTTTLTGIAAKIDLIKPKIAFVDGVYMMDDELGEKKGSPQALTNITRGFKRLALSRNIPIVISTQALSSRISRKDGITADSIGYSSSFAQDADTVLGVNRTDDEGINEVSVVIARSAPKMKTNILWDWESGTFEEMDNDPFVKSDNAPTL